MNMQSEEEVLRFWEKNKIYEKSKAARKNGKKFFFLDGPPYATGNIHVGHGLNYVLKDCYRRFFRMSGFNVWDQPGFDTHGVPIENKVEKKLGFQTKKDIEKFGVEKFVNECRKFAIEFISEMTNQFKNLGIWMEWENPYLTLKNEYIEGAWFTFKKASEKSFLYKGNYPVHVCSHCETAVAYNEIEHQKVKDYSLYVKLKVKGKENEYLLIWTTTPWTIPANTAVMANPNAEYVKVKVRNDFLILSNHLLMNVMRTAKNSDYEIVETFKGKDLKDLKYEHPLADMLPFQENIKNAHRIVLSEQYVTLEDGTGLVHTSPGHGQEDYKVGLENKLPVLSPVGMDGTFRNDSGRFSGLHVKKANTLIVEELKNRNLIFYQGEIEHEYPFCWRCDTPLIQISVPQWFFKVTKIRDSLIKENKKIRWHPKWAGERFNNWLESLGDWPVSRQRYWGIPLPIWECKNCGEIKVVGSRKELPKFLKDFHKPHVDQIFFKCKKCKGEMRRTPDVMDVWFDSGVAPWASLEYPSKENPFKKMWPADLVLEGPDQIRGWWNSLLITSVITFGEKSFDNVLFHGFMLDSHGVKMAKSKGNVVTPEEVVKKYGRDVLRFYYLSHVPWDDSFFKWEDTNEISKSLIVVKNVFNFVKTYVENPGKPTNIKIEDKWILSKLNSLIESSTKNFENYNAHKAARDILDFILNDFSRWYVKIIRDRVWVNYKGEDKSAAFHTLYTVAKEISKLVAPFTPFMSEMFHQNIISGLKKESLSVHLNEWPTVEKKMINRKLEEEMETAKQIFEVCQAARQKAGIKLRWPVRKIVIVSEKEKVFSAMRDFKEILTNMCNAKIISAAKEKPRGDFVEVDFPLGKLFLDKEIDEWILSEALFREVVRYVQEMRKKNGFQVKDMISVTISSDEKTNKKLKEHAGKIKNEVGARKVLVGRIVGKYRGKFDFEKSLIEIAFDKV